MSSDVVNANSKRPSVFPELWLATQPANPCLVRSSGYSRCHEATIRTVTRSATRYPNGAGPSKGPAGSGPTGRPVRQRLPAASRGSTASGSAPAQTVRTRVRGTAGSPGLSPTTDPLGSGIPVAFSFPQLQPPKLNIAGPSPVSRSHLVAWRSGACLASLEIGGLSSVIRAAVTARPRSPCAGSSDTATSDQDGEVGRRQPAIDVNPSPPLAGRELQAPTFVDNVHAWLMLRCAL